MPKFNGDKTKFEIFWATFESIVDETDEPAKYKMIRLKSCLEGKAEEAISRLGFSGEAYEEAKNTLKRRFGGERRQLQNYLEEIKKIRPLQEGNIQELEKFANLSTKYWIPAAREEIRQWENECNECKRRKARVAQQIMAPLPLVRLRLPLRAFARVSVDYGGPFITVQGRGKRREKRWLCLFTCLTCRAVHLEMSFGLDTDSFLKCFVRMASRRGYPQEIVSDRGTNFIGADRELRELLDGLDRDKIKDQTVSKGVKWFFNPPLAPHFGGVHEVMIKAAKKAIRAILGDADVNDEELMTTFTGVEALMNSRPLTYQSANPKDVTPLTPNHFLHGQAGGLSAPASVDEKSFNPRKRWRRIQELISHFWKRWMKEWLPLLNRRQKWNETRTDLKVGDVVLAISPESPRAQWPFARVLEVFSGQDGHVRVVKLQVGKDTIVRPISKCVPLESNRGDEEQLN